MRWEVADDERFARIVARGEEVAEAAWAPQRPRRAGRPRAGPLVLVPLPRARRAQRRRPHAHRAGGRRARRRCASRSPAASATTSATTRRGATPPPRASTSCSSSATTSTSTASRPERGPPPRRRRGRARSASTARATPPTRATRSLQAAHARRAVADGLGRPRGRQRLRRPAGPGPRGRLRDAARRRLPGLLGAHAVPEVGAAARPRHAHHRPPRLGPRSRASICSTTASTAIRRPARSRAAAARTPSPLADCPALRRSEAQRCSAPSRSAGSPTAGTRRGRGTCSRSRR